MTESPVSNIRFDRVTDLVLGDHYSLTVIRTLLRSEKPMRFNELRRALPWFGDMRMRTRLNNLLDHEIVQCVGVPLTVGVARVYRLTESGYALRPVIEAIEAWALENVK